MAAMNMVSAGGFRGKLSFKKMSAGGRLCTSQKKNRFWVPAIKVRQPDGTPMKYIVVNEINQFLKENGSNRVDADEQILFPLKSFEIFPS